MDKETAKTPFRSEQPKNGPWRTRNPDGTSSKWAHDRSVYMEYSSTGSGAGETGWICPGLREHNEDQCSLISPWQKSSRHSTVPASRRTALRFGHILPVCTRIAPCPAGAGTVSVLAGLSPRTVMSTKKTTSAGRSSQQPNRRSATSKKRTGTGLNRSQSIAVRDTVSPPSSEKPGSGKGSGKSGPRSQRQHEEQ